MSSSPAEIGRAPGAALATADPAGAVPRAAAPRAAHAGPDAIAVLNVGKCYEIYERPLDRLKQTLYRGRRQFFREFWALRDVSFTVRPGEAVGIIGRNGSGKSTLLQIIAGTLRPTEGTAEVRGRVAALLELGSGFNPDFTGRENVYLNGSVLGVSASEVAQRFDEIAAFADIGEFIHMPVKTYSTGMVVRLAFAVQALLEPDVLIVDEALAVGDVAFRAKCYRRIERLRERGVTILLASHDNQTVADMCEHALLLEHGQAATWGDAKDVAEEYYRRVRDIERRDHAAADHGDAPVGPMAAAQAAATPGELEVLAPSRGTRLGDGRAEITGLALYDAAGRRVHALQARQLVRIELGVRFSASLHDPHIGVCLRDVQGRILVGGHTLYEGVHVGPVRAGQRLTISFEWPVLLNPGKYLLMFGVAEHDGPEAWKDCDIFFDYCEIDVYGALRAWGIVNVPASIRVGPENSA